MVNRNGETYVYLPFGLFSVKAGGQKYISFFLFKILFHLCQKSVLKIVEFL